MIRRTVTRSRSRLALILGAGFLVLGALNEPAAAQEEGSVKVEGPGSANFELAARFAPYKISDLVHSLRVTPRWIEDTDRFWYEWETSDGRHFYLVDPGQGTKTEIFDNAQIAAELTRITRDPWDAQHLPIRAIRFTGPNTIQFDVESSQEEEVEEEEDEDEVEEDQEDEQQRAPRRPRTRNIVHHFEYDVTTRTLRELEDYEEPDSHPNWASVSPDTAWVVFSREFNLWMMSYEEYERIVEARRGKTGDEAEEAEEDVEVEEIQLTTDGEKDFSWGSQGRGQNDEETEEEHKKRQPSGTTWSHDSRYFALTRQDRREVDHLWVVHAVGNTRPKLESYRYDMPGEENVTQTSLHVFDMESREMTQVEDEPWKDQRMGIFNEFGGFGGFGGFFFFGGGGGSTEPRITKWLSDSSDELYFWRRSRDQHRVDVMRANPATGEVTVVIEERLNTYVEHQSPARLENGDLIWWSEQDGWAHLYRYAADGTVRARLTEGPWHVDGLMGVNEDEGYAVFRANAREEGEDPYYMHTYRVGLNGSGLTLLNPGNYDHQAVVSESARYFIDNYSRVDTNPVSALFDASGRRIMDLETADLTALEAAGYQYPETYQVKADDGVTDIYGVMYKPYDFDPAKQYPIIAYVYPGPQTESVSKSFSLNQTEQALAQFGFIVIDRVGIYGHSGGGFMSTAAMLVYPDFFKVAVSSAGNHNNDVYNANWSEKHDGVKEVKDSTGAVTSFEYDIDRNSDIAANLKGHLLLTTGDVDNNVHHAGTFRMAEALIRANKRFDFFI
ncbi:MAG: prolyl oligopeptidase family serine peptidase, partial [Gemmatimonadetes bacterium]|nr:prolyl oligopeptidase family serine peptidase [Gemmatimonadota bacterium]